MINERILNEFREHNTDPKYIVLITDIQNGEPVCNEESLIISTKQIFLPLKEWMEDYLQTCIQYSDNIKQVLTNNDIDINNAENYLQALQEKDYNEIEENLKKIIQSMETIKDFSTEKILKNLKTIDRQLTIYSNININNDNLYIGELNGYISKENVSNSDINSNTESSHWIEIVDTVLQKTIDITFNRRYENIPKVIITIDESDEKLYRNYSTSFVKDNDCLYTGVQITFNNLKNKNSYPKLGVTIIGDEKTEKYDDEGNLLPEYKELTLNLFYTVFNEEKNEDEDVPIIGHTVTIDENEYITNKCGTITEQFTVGEHSISIPDYTDENDVIHYSNIEELIQNLEDNTIIPVEFSLTPAGEDNDSG